VAFRDLFLQVWRWGLACQLATKMLVLRVALEPGSRGWVALLFCVDARLDTLPELYHASRAVANRLIPRATSRVVDCPGYSSSCS